VYGSKGGDASGIGGLGGYSSGVYKVIHRSNIYLHIGNFASSSTESKRGYNGGGYGVNIYDGTGGGATDFRTISGTWDSNLNSRIIVAGGGGGGHVGNKGGDGGGINGTSISADGVKACYGTQNGCIGEINLTYSRYMKPGEFGIGAARGSGSGGSGYYGGGSSYHTGGGGGSGYIGGVISIPGVNKTTLSGANNNVGYAKIVVLAYRDPTFHYMNRTLSPCFIVAVLIIDK